MKRVALLMVSILLFNIQPAAAEDVLPESFFSYLGSKYLADPGIILIDQSDKHVVYQKGETELRAPASVLKLISTSAIALNMETSTVFKTAVYTTNKPGEFLIAGDDDPWITSSAKEAARLKRAYLPDLLKAALNHKNNLKTISLLYTGVSGSDIKSARRALRKTSSIRYKALADNADTATIAVEKIAEIKSPPLASSINFTLLYSDNLLAQRLAMLATVRFGYPSTKDGLSQMVNDKLTSLNINIDGLHLEDGNGLSGGDRVSALTVSQLLLKIKTEPKLKIIYDSLPVSGQSGTLIGRYHGTAPQAVGLVRAKTGSTRHTIALAGYATSGDKEYVFVVIANHVGSTRRKQDAARSAIDRMLGTITRPPTLSTTTS
jgi:serine-type D-Ala-D-Ala carboxypeptidase/endopeptidase (penicillin-binding protein 4)